MSEPYKPRPTRAERRAAAREAAKQLVDHTPPPTRKGFRWDYTLAFVVAIMTLLVVIFPPQTVESMLFWLAIIFVLGIYPASHLVSHTLSDNKRFIYPLAVGGWLCVVALIGFYKWPLLPYYRQLSDKETKAFADSISKPPAGAEQLRLGCPQTSEEICITAGQFLPLFQRAGWTVEGNQIQRLLLPKPVSGVALFRHGEGTPVPSNPDLGLWIKQSPGLIQIVGAFKGLHMPPQQAADASMPDGVIGIYFGPAPVP